MKLSSGRSRNILICALLTVLAVALAAAFAIDPRFGFTPDQAKALVSCEPLSDRSYLCEARANFPGLGYNWWVSDGELEDTRSKSPFATVICGTASELRVTVAVEYDTGSWHRASFDLECS